MEDFYNKIGCDYQEAMVRFLNDESLYMKFLKKFKSDPSYNDMIEAINKKNVEAAFYAAHTLKGVCGNLSLKRLYDKVCVLVEELRVGDLSHTDELLPPIENTYHEIIDLIDEQKG